MANKIRLGLIGANIRSNWASASHLPALAASPDVELTAVCTTKPESAEEARKKFGAKLAFHDYREMLASKEIDAVAIVIRVPSHFEPTRAAIEAGKHVYVEWPLARNTAEAEELTALAKARGVVTTCGLQSRVSPALQYMKELIDTGYVGEVLSCNAGSMRDGALQRPSNRTWMGDINQGSNAMTIAGAHLIEAFRFVAGNFARVSGLLTIQAPQWLETDTKKMVDITAPDNILLRGPLASGAIASIHIGAVPCAGSGYWMEIYGRKGTLIASGDVSPQRGEQPRIQGAQGKEELKDLEIPDRFNVVPADFPGGDAFNVGQMYTLFAQAIRTGESRQPTFETAVDLHRFLDTIKQSSDSGQILSVG